MAELACTADFQLARTGEHVVDYQIVAILEWNAGQVVQAAVQRGELIRVDAADTVSDAGDGLHERTCSARHMRFLTQLIAHPFRHGAGHTDGGAIRRTPHN